MKHSRIAIACALAGLLVAGTRGAGAQERPHGGPGGERPPGPPPMGEGGPPQGPPLWVVAPPQLERLALTDAQRRRLDQVREVESRRVHALEADVRTAEQELMRLLDADAASASSVSAAAGRVNALRGGIMLAHVTARMGLRDLLTAEQRARLRAMPRPRGRERPDGDEPGR